MGVLYDGSWTAGAAAIAYEHDTFFLGRRLGAVFVCAVLVPLLHWAFGLYTRIEIGAGVTKAARVSAAILLTALTVIVLSRSSTSAVVLWSTLVVGPLVLPRILLNANVRPARASFLATAVQSRGPILLVGGAGYIGTHVVADLLAANYRVRVLDRLIHGKRPIQEFLANRRFELIEGDVTDIVKLVEGMKDASAVVHLAGLVGDPACAVDEAFTRHANVIATRMAKEVALSVGVSRFVFASSCSVYGATDRTVCEDDPLNPVSLYARTKIDSERELLASPRDGLRPMILRFATVFGHSRRPRFDLVANLFTAQAMTDGIVTVTGERQWRPFIHVQDLSRAIVLALRADPRVTGGRIFNVGDDRMNMTIGQLADLVGDVVAKERSVRIVRIPDVADPRNYAVSFDLVRSVLGFEASVSMRAGVEEIVREFKRGTYGDYRSPCYSNLEMTKQALSAFLDPVQSARLYAPMAEALALRRRAPDRLASRNTVKNVALLHPGGRPPRDAPPSAAPSGAAAGAPSVPQTH
jgi:nucleoside-diphosphate-sugar epimerase